MPEAESGKRRSSSSAGKRKSSTENKGQANVKRRRKRRKRGFFSFLLMTGSKEITDMRDDDFEEFGKYIAEKTGGFFFDNCFYYKK